MMNDEQLKKYLAELVEQVKTTSKNASEQRRLSKFKYSFSGLPSSEQLVIWDYVWNHSLDLWICVQSFFYLESHMKDKVFLKDSWEVIRHWQKRVDNWGMCDALSKIYTKILEVIPNSVLDQLKEWNKSTNLWERRQSIVSLLYFSRTKKLVLPYETIIPFVDKLIDDREYYVQKAVGWSLRELYHVYPTDSLVYFENNIKKISPIAFTIAIEKLRKEDKDRLKSRRKASR